MSVVVLPAPLGPRKATNSPCSTSQVDAADRVHVAVLAVEQAAEGGPQAFLLLVNAVRLFQAADFDDCHRMCDYKWQHISRTVGRLGRCRPAMQYLRKIVTPVLTIFLTKMPSC